MEQLRRQPSGSFLEGLPLSTAPLPSRRYRTVAGALCAVWLLAVALIVLWPTPVDRAGGGALRHGLEYLYRHGLPAFVTYGVVEFMANVLMFVPLGLFWFMLTPCRWRWWAPAAGFALSTAIETTQLLVLPQRFATPHDVVANTLGSLFGTLVAALAALALLPARPENRSQ
jgi:hypothetical protein